MLGVEDESVFTDYEEVEYSSPFRSTHVSPARRICASGSFRKPHNHAYGGPVLCDFGEARIGTEHTYNPRSTGLPRYWWRQAGVIL